MIASLNAAPQAVVFDWGNVIGFNDRSIVVDFMCDSFHFSEAEFESLPQLREELVQREILSQQTKK